MRKEADFFLNLFEFTFSFHFSYLKSTVRLVSLQYLIFLRRFTASLIASSSSTFLELSFLWTWTDRTHTAVGERMVWRGKLKAVCFRCIYFFSDQLSAFNVDIIMWICSIILERMDYVAEDMFIFHTHCLYCHILFNAPWWRRQPQWWSNRAISYYV